MHYEAEYLSPLGRYLMVSDGQNLTGLWLQEQKYYAATAHKKLAKKDDIEIFAATRSWLDSYFAGNNPPLTGLSLAPQGTGFRRLVWDLLLKIPYGGVVTYGDLALKAARLLGKDKMSAQAIGGAVGHNPISIIVPCHRVVGAKGNLTGYAGGIKIKIKLLEIEGLDMARFYVPKKGTAL